MDRLVIAARWNQAPPHDVPVNGTRRVIPVIGDGTDSATGGAVVAVPGATAFVAAADELVQAVVVEHLRGGGVGKPLADRTADLIRSNSTARYPAMVVVAADDAGVHVTLHGAIGVTIGHADGVDHLATAIGDPLTRSYRSVSFVTAGAMSAAGTAPTEVCGVADLRNGVATAAGMVCLWSVDHVDSAVGPSRHTGTPPTAPPEPRPAASASPAPDRPDPAPQLLLSQLGGSSTKRPVLEGLVCRRGHFNDPQAHFCAQCGIAMHQASFVLVRQERPALGVLLFDTGEAFELSDDVVVGRVPADDSRVSSGLARALRPAGDISGLSRSHASIELSGWHVQLVDRGSLNGTFVWDRSGNRWDRLAPDTPRVLQPGDAVSFGRRTATFETSIRPG